MPRDEQKHLHGALKFLSQPVWCWLIHQKHFLFPWRLGLHGSVFCFCASPWHFFHHSAFFCAGTVNGQQGVKCWWCNVDIIDLSNLSGNPAVIMFYPILDMVKLSHCVIFWTCYIRNSCACHLRPANPLRELPYSLQREVYGSSTTRIQLRSRLKLPRKKNCRAYHLKTAGFSLSEFWSERRRT